MSQRLDFKESIFGDVINSIEQKKEKKKRKQKKKQKKNKHCSEEEKKKTLIEEFRYEIFNHFQCDNFYSSEFESCFGKI